jgi:hypothetical protein
MLERVVPVFFETPFVFEMQQIFVLTPLSKAEGGRRN